MESKPDCEELLTAGQLARSLGGRSRYGVKLALQRLGIQPTRTLNGTSYYEPDVESRLRSSMRGPNRKVATSQP